MGFIIFLHILVCILISIVILMQSGRGGGLTEHFAAAESMFGAKTNVFLVKTTTVLAILFFMTCLSLALLSAKKEKSLMSNRRAVPTQSKPTAAQPQPAAEAPATNKAPAAVPVPTAAAPEAIPVPTPASGESK